ncbi:cellulose biosynthesis cyclic di-GMP-binding regulatory protein BcsB [Paracoccus nototheniae]|uniref:Cyclic di-GMP-binding protein n=1 Tax=Paracoccus nototheniae TaxID=2489002 RepID=A0ABW4DZK3_9RHOB|nr:cellulose biosynthesis cyclic di-GMP-binding regulatory protein BcsB [Paracoccus nototheniae]
MIRHPRRFGLWLLAGCAVLAVAPAPLVRAQDAAPPTISLPGAAGNPAPQDAPDQTAPDQTAPVQAAPGQPPAAQVSPGQPAPAAPGPADSPMIQLQPRATEAPVGDAPVPVPVERDRALQALPTGDDWLLPLIAPTASLPKEVRIGQSLPAPGILRLTGETASTQLMLDLPASIITPTELRLALRSGVDVLTETAVLDASINGAAPVQIPLRNIGGFQTVTLPAAGLTAGPNTIALSVTQPHRIFCGPEASFDVWTEIDLSNSGAALPADALRPDAEGFSHALRAQLARSGSLDLLVQDGIDPAILRQASDAVMGALSGEGRLAVTSFYGIDAPRFAAVALIASDRSGVSYRKGATGAIVLQVEYQGDVLPDLTDALPALDPTRQAAGKILPGQPTPLSGLGTGDILGNTHYFRSDIPFTLPDTWLLLANQKARLTLRYGFSRSLAEGAILLVKVNDQTVRLLPLDRDGGQILPPLPVSFNANLLNPGRNILSFEMMVPGAPATEACPIRSTDMLVVLGDSTLDIPASPAMVLPGLAAPFSGLMPDRVGVPEAVAADPGLQAQAIRLASGLSQPPVPDPAVSLTVARLSELNLVPLDDAGVTQGQVQQLLFPLQQPAATDPVTEAAAPAAAPTFRLEMPEDQADAAPVGVRGRISGWFGGAFTSQGRLWRDANDFRQTAFLGSQQTLQDWMGGRTGTALLWRPDPAQPGALWLVLSPRVQIDDVADHLDRLIANRTAIGEAAVLRPDGVWDIWTPIRPPVLQGSLWSGDLRTILGNYASWSPFLFTLALLGLALISALPALFYVLATRERRDRR